MRAKTAIVVLFLLTASTAGAGEIIYPAGTAVQGSYQVSNLNPRLGDTLIFTRTFVNKSAFSISGLYLSDNLPRSFAILSQQLTINGDPVSSGYESGTAGDLISGYIPYRWTIDDPAGGTFSNVLQPGDSIHLEISLTCNDAGDFTLSDRYSVGFGNNSSLFGVPDTPIQLSVTIETGVPSDSLLPQRYLTSTVYPNPFNSEATIEFRAAAGKVVHLEIFDLLGRRMLEQSVSSNSGSGRILWDAGDLGTGIYLYRLSDSKTTTHGKLLLLK